MSCTSRAEAEEWATAIRNNVAALPQEAPTGKIGGANGYAGVNNLMNNAMAMKNTMVGYHLFFYFVVLLGPYFFDFFFKYAYFILFHMLMYFYFLNFTLLFIYFYF